MITKILKTIIPVTQNDGGPIALGLRNNTLYYLKANIVPIEAESKKQSECIIKIVNVTDFSQEIQHRFFKKDVCKFPIKNFTPYAEDFCICGLGYNFPNYNNNPKFLFLELTYIRDDLIDNLKTSKEKKEDLYLIIERYLNDDFKGAISDISIFGEYIAKEIAKKTNKLIKDFRTALNILVNVKMSKQTKINYNYIGSLLWPLYYVRNQKLHPYHKINFNGNTADLCFTNLSEIMRYLSENGVKF